jgi:glycerol-3-phosphate dehydrogenase
VETEFVRCNCIVNAAGSGAAAIARMIEDESFSIKMRLGEYLLLNRNQGHLVTRTIFPCPGPLGKGVLVQRTVKNLSLCFSFFLKRCVFFFLSQLWGNLILGPTARDIHHPDDLKKTPEEIHSFIVENCRRLVPGFSVAKGVFHAFRGARARSSRKDWIIEPSLLSSRFIHVAGIDSPGLAASPAIAKFVVKLVEDALGHALQTNPKFNPNRRPTVFAKSESIGDLVFSQFEARFESAGSPRTKVICKCERVTEFEVVDSIHRCLPVDSTPAIRRRTRAGMGLGPKKGKKMLL